MPLRAAVSSASPLRLLVGVLALLAASASAQSQFARGAGAYVTLDALDPLRLDDGEVEAAASAGWRFGNGLDVGLRLSGSQTEFATVYDSDRVGSLRVGTLGLEAGYTRWVTDRAGLRLATAGRLGRAVYDRDPTRAASADGVLVALSTRSGATNEIRAELRLSTFLRRHVRGNVSVQPTLGLFTAGSVATTTGPGRPFSLRADAGLSYADGDAGLLVGVPVLFRALGLDLAADISGGYEITETTLFGTSRLRLNL